MGPDNGSGEHQNILAAFRRPLVCVHASDFFGGFCEISGGEYDAGPLSFSWGTA